MKIKVGFMLFCFIVGVVHSFSNSNQQCTPKCTDHHDPECLKIDYCNCNVYEHLHEDSVCHNSKLLEKDQLENSCCGSNFENTHAYMFKDRCEVS